MSYTYDSEPQKNLSHKQSVLFYGPSRTNHKHHKTPPQTFWFIIDLEKDQLTKKFQNGPKKLKLTILKCVFGPVTVIRSRYFWSQSWTEFLKNHRIQKNIFSLNKNLVQKSYGNYINFHHLLEMSHHSMSHFPFR